MKHTRYPPGHPILCQIVRHYDFQEFDGTGNPNEWLTLFPNCTTNLCITLDSKVKKKDQPVSTNEVSTSCISPVSFSRCNPFNFIVVQFEPYGFHTLTGIPMKFHTNSFYNLDDFFLANELERLYQRLYESDDDQIRAAHLDAFILKQLKKQKIDQRIQFASQQIRQHPKLSIDQLISHLGISSRRFRELFSRQVGISPKHFLRLSRFNQVTSLVCQRKYSLTEVALEGGYYDQAHFIKEFKEFAGVSPSQFRKFTQKSAEFYNE